MALISGIYHKGMHSAAHYSRDARTRPSNWAFVPKNNRPTRIEHVNVFLHAAPEVVSPFSTLEAFVKDTIK